MEKKIFCRYKKDFGSKLYLFPCKSYSFLGLLFSVFWFVKSHSFKTHALHFQLNYECDVIFAVPQICAYFVDNPNNFEIYSFKIAISEHILLYFKNSNSFFLCTHDNVRHTLCQTVMTHGVLSFSTGKHSTYFYRFIIYLYSHTAK